MPRLRQFIEILWRPVYVNLQRFYDAPFASIYGNFVMPRFHQFTDFVMARLRQFSSLSFWKVWFLTCMVTRGFILLWQINYMLHACYLKELCLPENDPVNHFLQEHLHDLLKQFHVILFTLGVLGVLFSGSYLHALQIILPKMILNHYLQ